MIKKKVEEIMEKYWQVDGGCYFEERHDDNGQKEISKLSLQKCLKMSRFDS